MENALAKWVPPEVLVGALLSGVYLFVAWVKKLVAKVDGFELAIGELKTALSHKAAHTDYRAAFDRFESRLVIVERDQAITKYVRDTREMKE